MLQKLFLLLLLATPLAAQTVVEVRDGDITGTVTWTSANTYVLVGRVFVPEDATLIIEPGTVVKGRFNSDPNNAAALVVSRGAVIIAEGTAEQPIIFTAEADDLTDPDDLTQADRGLWGGVIVLGRARINVAGGTENIEGIPETDPRGVYGGTNDADSSGVIRYVSIRHGGARIAPNNEINGLTMGAVGTGTIIEYVEVFANQDDGFEWFGGTVNTKYLVSAFCGDDAFDYDEGFRGKGQFWFAIQPTDDAGSGGEFDGGTTPEDGQPFAIPTVYNLTMIGSGLQGPTNNDFALNIDDNAGGLFFNSIFTEFKGRAVLVEDGTSGEDTYNRLLTGDLQIKHNVFYNFGLGGLSYSNEANELFRSVRGSALAPTQADFVAYMTAPTQSNRLADPMLRGISRTATGTLDPRPRPGSPALTGAAVPPTDGFFTAVTYLGAFSQQDTWITGWTALATTGFLADLTVDVEDSDLPVLAEGTMMAFPNPFRTSTDIAFTLAQAQHVHLAVYDLMGREIAVLVDEHLSAGAKTASFEAGSLASGMYLYRLTTDSGTKTQTMVVVR